MHDDYAMESRDARNEYLLDQISILRGLFFANKVANEKSITQVAIVIVSMSACPIVHFQAYMYFVS